MEKETQKKQKGSFTGKQAFGIILFVVSCVVLLCLISAGKLFGYLGVEIFKFVLGTFGYSSYAVVLFLLYLGLSIFADLKLKIRKRTLAFLFLSLLFVIFIFHNVTSAPFYSMGFGDYEQACFQAGLEGLSTATFGGVVFGFPCYFLAKLLTVVGSYIICSLALVGMLCLLFDVKRFWQNKRSDAFGAPKKQAKPKTDGVKDYDVSDLPDPETLGVDPVDRRLFVADIDDFLPKRNKRKTEALDILLSNQTPGDAEKITYMDGRMYTAKADIADKLGADIFNGDTSYSDSYSKQKSEKKKEPAPEVRRPVDKRSLILTPPDSMEEYLQNLNLMPEDRRKPRPEPETKTLPLSSDKIQARDLRGERPAEEPPEPPQVNRYQDYANGIFIDNTEKDRKRRERAGERNASSEEPASPILPAEPARPNPGYGSADSAEQFQSGSFQKPIVSQPAKRAEPTEPERGEPVFDDRPPIISDSSARKSAPAPEPSREEGVRTGQTDRGQETFGQEQTGRNDSANRMPDVQETRPAEATNRDVSVSKPGKISPDVAKSEAFSTEADNLAPIISSAGTGEVSYHEQKPVDIDASGEQTEIPEPKHNMKKFTEREPEPVFEDSTVVPEPKKPRKYIYNTPPVELLNDFSFNPNNVDENFEERKEIIEQTLSDFRIEAKVVNIVPGPSVTRYELQMPPGIPVSRVIQRADDIAMAVASSSGVRIEAPIPGKSLVGIEVPNRKKQMVVLRDVLDNPTFFAHQSPIVFALGKEIDGKNMLCDIAKMPHLLVAGSTGSGKSVCLNALILSILYKASPEDVRIILVDPKRVEFAVYTGLPHLLLKDIITDVDKAISALNWTVGEMTRRFDLFKQIGAKDIASYNAKIDRETTEKLPRIVLIVDELAELMATKQKADVELKIQRITQLSRAAGIHLVLATQRPSVDVITGVIKANLPSRIAFRVSSQIDSRTILDAGGGEKLLGNGDMIYTTPSVQQQMRLQGPFVSMEEVEAVVEFIKTNNEAYFDDLIERTISNVKPPQPEGGEDKGEEGDEESGVDKIFVDALRLAVDSGQISISMVQRRFSVGYARAGKLIDEMEKMGYVSPFEGSKPRKVLITVDEFNQKFGGDLM